MSRRRALFLDRDGVINVDHRYVYKREDFVFIDGIFDLCRSAKNLGYLIIIVTNQAGIGRGYYTEQNFINLTEWMREVFRTHAIVIDEVYFCPYHPVFGTGQYKVESACRKPAPGMILQAALEFDIDLERSVLVGDKESDVKAGVAAGVGCNILYLPISMEQHRSQYNGSNAIVSSLLDVESYLLDRSKIDSRNLT